MQPIRPVQYIQAYIHIQLQSKQQSHIQGRRKLIYKEKEYIHFLVSYLQYYERKLRYERTERFQQISLSSREQQNCAGPPQPD